MSKNFGKVAVLMGGWSAEREVSLNSGQAVLEALLRVGVDAHKINMQRDIYQVLQSEQFDCAFNILHGQGGEDGVIQGLLEVLELPYTGSGVMASAIAMDKLMTKNIWKCMGLKTPHYVLLDDNSDFNAVVAELGLPLIVKPTLEGSSVGMSKVNQVSELASAYALAKPYGQVFVEQWVTGEEYTASIVGDEALPVIRLRANSDFYDYEAKYHSDETQYFCPCGLSDEKEQAIKQLAMQAFKAIGCKGWGRVDIMMDEKQTPWLIEVNTAPGMTDHSLVPMAALQHGWNFEALVVRILELAD